MKPSNAPVCPLCGSANECAPARSGSFDTPCWCTSVTISPDALAALPAEALGRACLCARCATAAQTRGDGPRHDGA